MSPKAKEAVAGKIITEKEDVAEKLEELTKTDNILRIVFSHSAESGISHEPGLRSRLVKAKIPGFFKDGYRLYYKKPDPNQIGDYYFFTVNSIEKITTEKINGTDKESVVIFLGP